MKCISVVSIFLIFAGFAVSTADVAAENRKNTSNLPITIKSNELTADNKGKTALFSGKVVAKQGDVTIFCDRMMVYYGSQQGEIDRIEADGSVRIVQENRTGMADHAVYESRDGRITLTGGSPRVMQGADSVSGKIITYLIDDDRSSVSGGGDSRVEAVINPKQKNDVRPKKGNADKR